MTRWTRPRGEADRLRAVPLETVLLRCGAQRDRHDPKKWHSAAGTLSVSGAKFMNWQRGNGGGGAIDLVIHLRGGGFGAALAWLSRHCADVMPMPVLPLEPRPALRLPPPESNNLAQLLRYLTGERGLPPAAVETLIRSGDLYADARANAVFVLRGPSNAPVGAELRGTTPAAWRGMAPGSNKDSGFFAVGPSPFDKTILCESAIDAISACVLFPDYRTVSTAGARPRPAWLSAQIQCGPVLCGFDADPTGDAMAAEMIAAFPAVCRMRPSHHDWNDVLRARS
jgi:hypothetical protein